jgi:hypothetical protein
MVQVLAVMLVGVFAQNGIADPLALHGEQLGQGQLAELDGFHRDLKGERVKESDTADAEIRPVEQAVDILPGSFGRFSFAASEIRKVCATMLVCLSGDRDLPECRRLEKVSNRRRRGAEGTHAADRPRDAALMPCHRPAERGRAATWRFGRGQLSRRLCDG